MDPLQYHTSPTVQIFKDLDSILLCSHELVLPGISTLHARMLLGAWMAGLEDVSEESARQLLHALKVKDESPFVQRCQTLITCQQA